MTGDDLRDMLDAGAAGIEAAQAAEAAMVASVPSVPVSVPVAEGFEVSSVEKLEPISEAERAGLRLVETPRISRYHYLEPGPRGQYVSGSH